MAAGLRAAARVLPLTYAYDALDRVTRHGALGSAGAVDVAVIACCIVLALALGAATLRRRTP
jgi:ABC-2 type transport system permease protein